MEENKYPIKEEWSDYYNMLESIRQSGITNMFGAAPYLAEFAGIDKKLASQVLASWMHNYSELNKKFSWR